MTAQLEYTNHLLQFFKNIAGIMPNAFLITYYAQNYAGIISWSLAGSPKFCKIKLIAKSFSHKFYSNIIKSWLTAEC